jgi:xanthine dehydrogenase YagR molybdenum-binding subunit
LRQEGDAEAALKASAHVIEGICSTQVQTHTSLETHGGICEWEGENLTAWVSTQAVHGTRNGVAKSLGIPQTACASSLTTWAEGSVASWAATCDRHLRSAGEGSKAPVKLMLNRKEEHLVTGNRPSAYASSGWRGSQAS